MSLRLWDLASLALPLLAILVVQAIAMAGYAVIVTFRVMGRDYDAAVLAAGHCGFGLGCHADCDRQHASHYGAVWPLPSALSGGADGRERFLSTSRMRSSSNYS
ncbi:Sodium/glutamate symporter [Pararobbsia alpina]|uniref:Sodium/glutamate symporter n=1 Tax=Pararobbsia alpina TaxID=621374 RepID=A0A6S7BJL1_9BURK|nr:Sodium/glutamate symporter [Pararobbsia alpina]